MKTKLILVPLSGAVLLAALFIFIKSPSFLNLLEEIAGRSIGGSVEIDSLSLENRRVLTVRGLVIKGGSGDGFHLTVARLALTFRLKDLVRMHIGEIVLTGPELLITVPEEKDPAAWEAKSPLPFSFDTFSLIDGRIYIYHEEDRSFQLSPVNLLLERDTRTGRTSLSAHALLSDLNSEIAADAIIDMETLRVESAHVHLPAIDLEMLSGLPYFTVIKDADLQGIAGLELTAVPQDTGAEAHTLINAALTVSGLSARSDALRVNLGERRLNISFNGAHHRTSDRLDIDALRIDVSQMGLWTVSGTLERVSSGNPNMNLTIKGTGAELNEISDILSGPVVAWLHEIAVSGSAGADVSVTGSLTSPEARGVFTASGESVKAANIFFNSFEVSLPLEFRGGVLMSKDASAAAKEFATVPGVFFQRSGISVRGQGAVHAGFKITFPENSSPHVDGTFEAHVKKGSFSSTDETVIGEAINADLSGRFALPLSLDSIDFSVSSEASGFELLAGRFYGAFSDRPVHCLAEGRYTKADDTLTMVRSTIGLAGIGDLLMTGTVSTPGGDATVDADVTIEDLSSGEAFDFFIRETFREQYPLLSRIRIDGQSSLSLNIRGSFKKFTAHGNVRIAGMEIVDVNSGNAVRGVNMSLPFDISFPEAGPARAIDTFETLRIGDITWPPLQASGFEASAAVGGNTLVFKENIRIPLYGGSVTLKKVSYSDILSPHRSLRLAADLDGIDLALAGKALEVPGLSGSVNGTIPSASFTDNRLATEGEIILELFGGTIRVSGFSAENVFSPRASVRSDIRVDSINLGALSRAFEFGHVSGIMRGELRDLVIVNGQAQRFQGYLETYRKKGVEQRISVEALKKISILGTGSSASVLDRGIYQFFRDYRYEQIGFRATLRNDNLLLLGLGQGNETQYLVKGGLLPPKVDVITYNQNISFKELVSRLKRISQMDRKEKR